MNSCRLCNSSFIRNWTAKDAKTGETLQMALCGGCGLVQQSTLPTDEELKIYYSHNYREDYKSTHQPKPKYVYRAGLAAKDRLAFIERAGVQASGKRLLDIGAGGGEFCYMAGKAGFAAQGIEPHHGYSEFARDQYEVSIRTCGIAELEEQQADVVTMFHVFEHLAHPRDVIKKIWNVLDDNGHLVIEVPNIHQADSSPHNIYFKAHLFYYSRYSLMAAVSQYFELVCLEDEHNLFMAFRKRNQPLAEMVLPSPAQVQKTAQRLDQKGWKEYLIEGSGWKKIFLRISKSLDERKLNRHAAKCILDDVWSIQPKRNSVMIGVGLATGLAVALGAYF